MALPYKPNGDLEPGFHDMSWEEFTEMFNYNQHRARLFEGLDLAMEELRAVGCTTVYIDGSFVSKMEFPDDFDLCWGEEGVDIKRLRSEFPGLVDYGFRMKNMKKRYGGDIVPCTSMADMKKGLVFLAYFMQDKQGRDKGVIRISLF